MKFLLESIGHTNNGNESMFHNQAILEQATTPAVSAVNSFTKSVFSRDLAMKIDLCSRMFARRAVLTFAAFTAISLQACQSSDPVEQQADAFEAAGRNRADQIEADAISRAKALEAQAGQIDQNAVAAGGYTKRQLDVSADALRKQAVIIKEQGRARAAAAEAEADAKAKALRAR